MTRTRMEIIPISFFARTGKPCLNTRTRMKRRENERQSGLTLVEMMIAMTLLSLIFLSVSSFLMKGNAVQGSLGGRYKEALEIHSLINSIQSDLRNGAYISPNSYDKRLEYTTMDASGVASKKIYRITTISGSQYLQLSSDSGSTWGSPYTMSSYDRYKLTGTPRFLYAWGTHNCTDFPDTSGNGVYGSGDSAGSYVAGCSAAESTTALSSPSQASKVDLNGFVFTTGTGVPESTRSLPSHLFLSVGTGFVRSAASAVSPAAKDTQLVQSFSVNTANSLFKTSSMTTWDVRGLCWDPARERLAMVGRHTGGVGRIYLTDRDGVLMAPPGGAFSTYALGSTIAYGGVNLDSCAFEADNKTTIVLDDANRTVHRYNLHAPPPLDELMTAFSVSSLVSIAHAVAFDPSTPDDFYLAGKDSGSGAWRIYERTKLTGASSGSGPWSLPAAFTDSAPPSAFFVEPVTGDFVVLRNYVNGSSPNKTIDIYRVTRSGSSTSFSINIDDLGSTATGTTGEFGMTYDPILNRLFISDSATQKVYEVVPDRLISQRS